MAAGSAGGQGGFMPLLARLPAPFDAFTVHRAESRDVAAIVALLGDDPLGRDREGEDPGPYLAAFTAIDRDPNQLLLVVRDEAGSVVATMHVAFLPGLSRCGMLRAQLEAVRVDRTVRGGGLGSAFLAWVLGECRRRGAGLAQLTTDKRRVDAQRFYARAGFVASHEGMKV